MISKRKGVLAGAALATLLAIVVPAWGQGLYYREAERDGKLYAFNLAKEFEAFQNGTLPTKPIERLGWGPKGETVVFDSVEALNLFAFKHGKAPEGPPAPPAPEAKKEEAKKDDKKPKMEVSWKDGKTTFGTDKAQLQLSNRVQARWTQELPDDTVQAAGTANKGDGKGSFRIRRAKTKFEGWFYNKELTYEVQVNWPDVTGSPASRVLEDAWIGWDISKDKTFMLKFGQYKVPFGRQELTSSGSMQFVDRTDVSNRYARGRETGLQIHGLVSGGKLEWRAGLFNGNGRSQTSNDNAEYQYNARLTFQPNGDPKYSESDFETSDKLLWSVGVGFEHNDKFRATTNVDTKDRIFGFDGTLKYKGFSTVGEYFIKNATPETGAKFDDKGFYVQAGMLFAKRTWELAFRYGQIDPSDLKSDDKLKEVGGALNYFYNKHNLKVQADFRNLKNEATDVSNNELRVQAQFIF